MTPATTEYELRERCRELCAKHPGLPRLLTIAAVGAYDGEIGGTEKDSQRLTSILNYLLDCGYLIDPGFEIDVVNFREGRDFLKENKKADLVVVSYILNCRPFNNTETFGDAAERIDAREDKTWLSTLLSWRNHTSGWASRLGKAETKIVATYGGEWEVNTDFLKYEFEILIPSPEDECADSSTTSLRDIQKLYPALKDIDVPMGWLGFVAEPEYLKAIAPALNPQTCLGRRGLNPEPLLSQEPEVSQVSKPVNPYAGSKKKFRMDETVPDYRKLKSNRAYRFR